MKQTWPVLPMVRIPMGTRLRIAADALRAAARVPKEACTMRQRRCFRLAMIKEGRKRLPVWRANVR